MLTAINHPEPTHVQSTANLTCGWACLSMIRGSAIPSVFSGKINVAMADGLSLPDMLLLATNLKLYLEPVTPTALSSIVNNPSIYLMHSINSAFARPHWFLFEVSSTEDIISIYDPIAKERQDFDYDCVPSRYRHDIVSCHRIIDCHAIRHETLESAPREISPADWGLED